MINLFIVFAVKHNRVNYSNQVFNTTYVKVCCKTKVLTKLKVYKIMVLPLVKQYAVSAIQKENKQVSLHLIHTFGDMMDYMPSIDFYNVPLNKRGTCLESIQEWETFEFPNPFITSDAQQVLEFMSAARRWAENRIGKIVVGNL